LRISTAKTTYPLGTSLFYNSAAAVQQYYGSDKLFPFHPNAFRKGFIPSEWDAKQITYSAGEFLSFTKCF
jgi:hypothetical protein